MTPQKVFFTRKLKQLLLKVEEMNIQGRFELANEFIKRPNLAKFKIMKKILGNENSTLGVYTPSCALQHCRFPMPEQGNVTGFSFCWLPINAIFARIAMPWPRATLDSIYTWKKYQKLKLVQQMV
jgi:hypothetical protein